LREKLRLPEGIRGRTNPRSSTGRLDVFTRVITDRGNHFDEIRDGYEGELFLEVVPMSFTVKGDGRDHAQPAPAPVRQARLTDEELIALSSSDPIAFPGASSDVGDEAYVSDGLFLSVDLSGAGRHFAGYRAKPSSGFARARPGERLPGRRLLGARLSRRGSPDPRPGPVLPARVTRARP